MIETPLLQEEPSGIATSNQAYVSLSRRKWLGRISAGALAVAGTSMIGTQALAAEPVNPGAIKDGMAGAGTYNIRDFGAKGDGKMLDTAPVQAAIDACHRDNGGTVLVPAGDFVIGTIELKSNVTLHLANQGRLLGSPRREDYRAGKGVPEGNGNIVLLYAVEADNIAIEGRGTLDGNGKAFYTGHGDNTGPGNTERGYMDRPHLAIFYKCTNLLMRDTFFTQSAYHCFRILHCQQINIDGIRIYNRINKNNDGFHFNSCQYVHISNCDVRCQDDACALFGSNQFVTVTNCSFSTRWSIFRFGSGAAQHIAVSNCLIYETYGCPIKISSGRAQLENLTFSNIIMRNVTGPIGIGFSGASQNSSNAAADTAKPFVRNIVFNGIRATVVPLPVNHPDIPFEVYIKNGEQNSCITLNGMGEAYLENISFTDVHVTYAGGGTAAQAAKRDIPKIAREYFGVWDQEPAGPPAYGLYARNVKGLTLQNVRFDYEKPDARPAVVFDNVQEASINGLSAQGSPEVPLLRFTNTKDVMLSATRVLTSAAAFLSLEGTGNEGIPVDGGDLRKAGKPVVYESGATKKSVNLRV
ncbi:glycoside hydrolase family 28 protein [Botryobacter ruber]|uniref:glycoside hydrolase family 28 protein n=1 Tax=Botryobacter ruber TaxID=2171629 RepID=UPI000E0B77D0|nr:glycosyl hydrolase family 28 protein [Botryobacter ruber]